MKNSVSIMEYTAKTAKNAKKIRAVFDIVSVFYDNLTPEKRYELAQHTENSTKSAPEIVKEFMRAEKQPDYEPKIASVPESAVPRQETDTSFVGNYKEPSKIKQKVSKTLRAKMEEFASVPETDASIVGKSDIKYEPLSVFIEYVTAQEWSSTVDRERLLDEIEYAYTNGKKYWNSLEEFANLVQESFS